MSIEPTMSGQSQAPQHAAQPHVLVVDDDPIIRELVSDYLSGNELRVTTVADGSRMQAVLAHQVADLAVLPPKHPRAHGHAPPPPPPGAAHIPTPLLSRPPPPA